MPSATVTDQCPHWCAREHAAGTCGTAFYHASETSSVTISQPDGCSVPDRLDVQTAQYLPDDPGEPAWSPTVEIAVHAGDRYRLIGLTPEEARDLAVVLARAATWSALPRGKQPPRLARRANLLHNARPQPDGRWAWRYDRLRPPGAELDFAPLWADLSAVTVPVMLVCGAESGVVSDQDRAEFTSRQPAARLEMVDAAGHSIQGDRPLELAALIADFSTAPR